MARISRELRRRIVELYLKGYSTLAIARELGLASSTVYNIIVRELAQPTLKQRSRPGRPLVTDRDAGP